MFTTHFVARSEARARILSCLDPDTIPPGVPRYAWLTDQASIAIAKGESPAPFLQVMLDCASAIENAFWRLGLSAHTSLLAVLAGDLPFAATIWQRLSPDPARSAIPLLEVWLPYFEGVYLAAIGDARALDCLERSRRLSAECGWSLGEQVTASQQVSLLIDAGDLSAARQRMIEAISGHIRAGDHLTLWQSCHQLVRLLAELDRLDEAGELWTELHDRGGWTDPGQRANLEARLGPPGTPHLTDDELVARISELLVELD
jgi:hypothetical protein